MPRATTRSAGARPTNQSQMALLAIVVRRLSDERRLVAITKERRAAGHGDARAPHVHVPFGDSKLTLLLQEALGGAAKTSVIVCASLEPRNAVESIQALRFGEACSRVETRAIGGAAARGRTAARRR